MKTRCATVLAGVMLCVTPLMAAEMPHAVSNMGNVKGGDVVPAQSIINTKCTRCHSSKIIEAAVSSKKDMLKIQQEMEKKGARLNAKEREVLGIYWKDQNPLKKNK